MIYRDRVEIGPHVLYLGDCREILPTLQADAVVTDPPYGLGDKWKGSGDTEWTFGGEHFSWDAKAPDAEVINAIAAFKKAIIWGGNYYALPPMRGWLIWDKIQEHNSSHAEMAWTNIDIPVRVFRLCRAVAYSGGREHPTEKPLTLMEWCLGFIPDAKTILDPFMGSGTTGVACAKLGRKFIGVEIHEPYFRIACRRIADAVNGGVQPELFA